MLFVQLNRQALKRAPKNCPHKVDRFDRQQEKKRAKKADDIFRFSFFVSPVVYLFINLFAYICCSILVGLTWQIFPFVNRQNISFAIRCAVPSKRAALGLCYRTTDGAKVALHVACEISSLTLDAPQIYFTAITAILERSEHYDRSNLRSV